jgi:hypothetical protein
VKCLLGVMYLHGAHEDSRMTHIYIIPYSEHGIAEWKQPVTDEDSGATDCFPSGSV